MSMRLAPTQKSSEIVPMLEKILTEQSDDTFGAEIKFSLVDAGDGFCAPEFTPELKEIVYSSSKQVFKGNEPVFIGCGGSIPFMEVFSQYFPEC